jgi:hypothetical protein
MRKEWKYPDFISAFQNAFLAYPNTGKKKQFCGKNVNVNVNSLYELFQLELFRYQKYVFTEFIIIFEKNSQKVHIKTSICNIFCVCGLLDKREIKTRTANIRDQIWIDMENNILEFKRREWWYLMIEAQLGIVLQWHQSIARMFV